jgi:hypothetical protein
MKSPINAATKPIPNDLVSLPDAATLAHISLDTLYHWKRRRRIDVWGRPGYFRVSLAQILPLAVSADPKHYAEVSKPGPRPKPGQAATQKATTQSPKDR